MGLGRGLTTAALAGLLAAGATGCGGSGALPAPVVGGPAGGASVALAAAQRDPMATLRATDWADYRHYLDFDVDDSPYGLANGRVTGDYRMTLLGPQQYGTFRGRPAALVVVNAVHDPADPAGESVEEYLFTVDARGAVVLYAGASTPTAGDEAAPWCSATFRLVPQGVEESARACSADGPAPSLDRTLVPGPALSGPDVPDEAQGVRALVPLDDPSPSPGGAAGSDGGGSTAWHRAAVATVGSARDV